MTICTKDVFLLDFSHITGGNILKFFCPFTAISKASMIKTKIYEGFFQSVKMIYYCLLLLLNQYKNLEVFYDEEVASNT